MNPTPHISTLRHTHRAATSLLPVLTASLTVIGVVLAAMEARAPQPGDHPTAGAPADELAGDQSSARGAASRTAERLTARAFIATLVGRALLVTLGIVLVLALVYAASASGRTGQAILMTALILLALYLTEKVARRA